MDYNHDISIASIHNIVVALNAGGMLSCDDIMNRSWNLASGQQQGDKITAARNPANHTEAYARQQLRQEVRRSLYSHFNDPESTGFDIYRATAHGDVERFWVAEEQVVLDQVDLLPEAPAIIQAAIEIGDMFRPELPDDASLFERLEAANNTETASSDLIRTAIEGPYSGNVQGNAIQYVNPDMPEEFASVLTETLSEEFCGLENTSANRHRIDTRVCEIIAHLEAQGL